MRHMYPHPVVKVSGIYHLSLQSKDKGKVCWSINRCGPWTFLPLLF